jgi:hypothetical protein
MFIFLFLILSISFFLCPLTVSLNTSRPLACFFYQKPALHGQIPSLWVLRFSWRWMQWISFFWNAILWSLVEVHRRVSETPVNFYQTTRSHILKDSIFQVGLSSEYALIKWRAANSNPDRGKDSHLHNPNQRLLGIGGFSSAAKGGLRMELINHSCTELKVRHRTYLFP